MRQIDDVFTSKHTPVYKAAVQRVIDTLERNEGKLFAASSEELQAIRDNTPHGHSVWEIIFAGSKRYMQIHGKHLRNSKKA